MVKLCAQCLPGMSTILVIFPHGTFYQYTHGIYIEIFLSRQAEWYGPNQFAKLYLVILNSGWSI